VVEALKVQFRILNLETIEVTTDSYLKVMKDINFHIYNIISQ